MSKSVTKTRQIELAIDELASRLAGPGSGEHDQLWLDWARSDQFGYRQEHWEKLAAAVGRKAALRGWPLEGSAAKTSFLLWARSRRGKNMGNFKEAEFISQALTEGWKLKGPSVEACRWALRQEAEMRADLASGASASRGEIRGLAERAQVSGASGSAELWAQMAREEPEAAPWLFKAAAWKGYGEEGAKERQERLARASGVIASLPAERLDGALAYLFGGWSSREESKQDSARLASELVAKGANWLAPAVFYRSGAPEATTALGKALRDQNEFAAQGALSALGPAAFWEQALLDWTKQIEASYYPWEHARGMALWAPKVGEVDPRCARLLLRAASAEWDSEAQSAVGISDAFKAIGGMARLEGESAWSFKGFASPGSKGEFKREGSCAPPARALTAREWTHRAITQVHEYGRQGANSGLGALILGLMEAGCPAPFESVKNAGMPPSLEALFEGWMISAAAPRRASEPSAKKAPIAL